MKKIITLLLLVGVLIFAACELQDPARPEITTITPQALPLSKIVYVGNSLTAGFQSGGLVNDFQMHSYPYFIAQQMGRANQFQMPLLAPPGFGSANLQTGEAFGPLKFENGQIVPGDPVPGGIPGIPGLLLAGGNAELSRPYDNLGVPGAKLQDVLTAYDANSASSVNPFFSLVLRNPNFGNTTQVQQAQLLAPTLVVVWIGNNDVLGAALAGGDPSGITPASEFQADYQQLLQEVGNIRDGQVGIILANIPNVTDIPYVNLLDSLIYKDVPVPGVGTVSLPVVFGSDFQPVDFDPGSGELYLPLVTEEGIAGGQASPVKHILLPFLSQYQASGLGVPDSTIIANTLIGLGFPPAQAAALAQQAVQGMIAAGLTPSGVPIPGSLTITEEEETTLTSAVDGYNQIIGGISTAQGIPMVDINTALNDLNNTGIDGYTGKFVLFDQENTAFSLDGIHPNNGGYAIIANLYIDKINQILGLNIPELNTADYKGQYGGSFPKSITYEAALQAKAIFTDY